MGYVFKACGCKFDVEEGWDYGCAGSCCPPVTTIDDVIIDNICSTHLAELNEKFNN